MQFLRTNTATRITVGPFIGTDGLTPATSLTVTNCKLTMTADTGGVPTLVLDTNPTASGGNNDMVHITGDDGGFYDLELTAANVNYLGRARLALTDAANHCPVFHDFMILPAMIYDSLILGTDRLDTNTTHINDVATSSVTTVSAYQGTTQPPQFTGTGSSARLRGDVAKWATVDVGVDPASQLPYVYDLALLFYGTASSAAGAVVTLSSSIDPTAMQVGAWVRVTGFTAGESNYRRLVSATATTITLDSAPSFVVASGDAVEIRWVPIGLKVDLDTIKTQSVTCSGGVTIPAATLASTTNITAASGVTVSTNGDKTGYTLTNLTVNSGVTLASGTHNPQGGDTYARLGAPVGASISADVAGVKTQTAAIETDTQDIQSRLPSALSGGRMASDAQAISGDTTAADNLESAYDGTGYQDADNINGPRTWYLAASGGNDSNSGLTPSQPLATRAQALTNSRAGDRIHLLAGAYSWTTAFDLSAETNLTITADAGATVTFTNASLYSTPFEMGSYCTIDGVKIVCADKGIGVHAIGVTNVKVLNCIITASEDAVFLGAGCHNSVIAGNYATSKWDIYTVKDGCDNVTIENNYGYSDCSHTDGTVVKFQGLYIPAMSGTVRGNTISMSKSQNTSHDVVGALSLFTSSFVGPVFRDNNITVVCNAGTGRAIGYGDESGAYAYLDVAGGSVVVGHVDTSKQFVVRLTETDSRAILNNVNVLDRTEVSAPSAGQIRFVDGEIADILVDTGTSGVQLPDGVITAAKIAADAITDAKVASDVTIASVTGAVGSVTGNVGGNVTGSVGSVASGGITSSSFGSGAIDASAIASNAITAAKIAGDAITAAKIADGAIDSGTFASGAIDATAIGTGAITSTKFASGAITATAIASDAITDAKVASDVTIASVTGSVGSVTGNVGGSVASISGVTFPTNFGSLGINASGHVSRVTLADTTTTLTNAPSDSSGTTTLLTRIGGTINVTNLNTLSSHDPGATLGTSTLTQSQVTGGAYALNSSSFSFDAGLDLTTTQKASVTTAVPTAASNATAVWANGTRVLTAGTNIVLAKGTGVTGFTDIDAAGVRTAIGLASANLDTQFDGLPTAVENAAAVRDVDNTSPASDSLGAKLNTVHTSIGNVNQKLGDPDGDSVSADIAAVKSDTAGVKTKTDQLVFNAGKVDANAEVTQDQIDEIVDAVSDAAGGFTTEQRAQMLAALSIGEDIGVPKNLTWVIVREDLQVKARAQLVKNASESNIEFAVDWANLLGDDDAVQSITSIELLSGTVTSPAFSDVGEAENWMNRVTKFRISGGTYDSTTPEINRIRVTVHTLNDGDFSVDVQLRVSGE